MANANALKLATVSIVIVALGMIWVMATPLYVTITAEHSFVRSDWSVKDAIEHDSSLEDIEALLAEDPSRRASSIGGELPIHWAARAGRADVTAMLLTRGANVNAPVTGDWGTRGNTPIVFAVWSGDIDTVNVLVDNGADLSARDQWGRGLVEIAGQQGHREIAELLRERRSPRDNSDGGDVP